MRVAFLSANAPRHNAVGNQIAEKVRFFQEHGAEVQVFVQDARQLHPELQHCCTLVTQPTLDHPAWDFLRQADLLFAVYAQYHDLLQYLPRLAGAGPRIVFDYHGVTPAELWHVANRETLERSARQRSYVWSADHALTTSDSNRLELLGATQFPTEHVTTLPLTVDTQRYRPDDDRWLQQRLHHHGPFILYVGRLAGNKRVSLLIEALARWSSVDAQVVIIGDDGDVYAEEANRCRAIAQTLGLADRVHFLGQVDDDTLARAYCSADVLVMPSLHEGFCVPVLEAMASGLPVIASRSAALPETVGAAGLTFTPNDADDLAHQLGCVLDRPVAERAAVRSKQPIAIVCFRFGPHIVGGAETSLRTMAKALRESGHEVEVFTTCTSSENRWQNDQPAGTTTLDGLTVHRFAIDEHDHAAHGDVVRAILDANGRVQPNVEQEYLQHSIHSAALIAALCDRQGEFAAIITGPYLFGLTADVAMAFPAKTLIVPCFHDESIAHLSVWPKLYGNAGGLLYHSAEEQHLAQGRLGVNHPNSHVIGTRIDVPHREAIPFSLAGSRPYFVYCGRYSAQKNLPLLLEWAERVQAEHRVDFVFMGHGEVALPRAPWLHDLGRVDEAMKRSVLAGAVALVQLSVQESLSLVALEAWAEETPVIAHANCPVLAGQIERADGGWAVRDYDSFATTLRTLLNDATARRNCGARGKRYVRERYANGAAYAKVLTHAIEQLRVPLREQMRQRGLQRAVQFSRLRWQQRFADFIERILTQPLRARLDSLHIEPLREVCHANPGTRTTLLPVRLVNEGTHAVVPEGPGRTVIFIETRTSTGAIAMPRREARLPEVLMPGQAHVAALPIELPGESGRYEIALWTERCGAVRDTAPVTVISLHMDGDNSASPTCTATFLDTVRKALPRAFELQQLPADYVDVSEGRFASVKKLVKKKLLNNFKHAYVDVLSRQQSQVNGQVVLMIQQLAECCAMLDHAVAGLHERMDRLEEKLTAAGGLASASTDKQPIVQCER